MSDELDEILDGLSKEMSKEEIKDVVVQEEDEIDASDVSEIEQELIKQTKDDRSKADQIFDLFYPNLGGSGHDRSQASKEAITKALELKIQASRNLIDLLRIKKDTSSKLGIFVDTVSPKKAGISVDNIISQVD
tara:strand:+ start:4749 stop:5150 length:402 start_codon:yes stop_codon:yes gene_type:complete